MAEEVKKERNVQTIFNNKSGLNVMFGALNIHGEYTDKVAFRIISKQKKNIINNEIKKDIKIIIDIEEYNKKLVEFGMVDKLLNKLSHKYKKYKYDYDKEYGSLIFSYDDIECITSTKLAIKYEKETMKILRAFNAVIAYLEKIISNKEARVKAAAAKKAIKKSIENEAANAIPGAESANDEKGFYEVDENNNPVEI